MTIYSRGKPDALWYKWQIAALEVPVPDRLIENEDIEEWRQYLDCLSPAQQVRKLGQALDEFLDMFEKNPEPLKLPEKDQIFLYSKWASATETAVVVANRLMFSAGEGEDERRFTSDIGRYLFMLTDFLEGVNSHDLPAWRRRQERHEQLTAQFRTPFGDFLKAAIYGFASIENSKKAPPTTLELREAVQVQKPLQIRRPGAWPPKFLFSRPNLPY